MAFPSGSLRQALNQLLGNEESNELLAQPASGISILDTGNFTPQATVEAALAEIYQSLETAQGFIPLDLNSWRLVASNDVPALAIASGNGGNLAVDSAPKLIRVNAATDKCLTINWAASSGIEIFNQFAYPPDMDVTKTYTVNLRVKSGGATDTPTIAIGLFEGIGDTNRGGTSAAIAAAVSTVSATITPTAGHPIFASVTIIPGAHTSDTVVLYEAWITYTKKLLVS
jgi:hypothetical protein